jgi:class 3 adenylate cyclase
MGKKSNIHAATQMRLAVEAKAASCTIEDAARVTKHKKGAEAYETLVTITFGAAATYFAKAANARAIARARELWREAAELLIENGLTRMRRTEGAAAMLMFTAAVLHKQSAAEIAKTSRAATCAACATAMDGLAVSEVDSANGLLPGAAPSGADTPTAVQNGTTTEVSYAAGGHCRD